MNDLQIKESVNRYVDAWTRTMLEIWEEKIRRMKIYDTGALHESFSSRIARSADGNTITMKFLQYGIYVAAGTGNGYRHGNGGYLEFLGREGKHRKRRDWYSPKLYMSVMAMKEDMARILRQEAAHVICEGLM